MDHFVFVHGTGVREPQFGATFDAVSAAIQRAIPCAAIHPCYWGHEFGSRIRGGHSIPSYSQSLALNPSDDNERAQWALLFNDPLIELRLLAAALAGGTSIMLGKPSSEVLRGEVSALISPLEKDVIKLPIPINVADLTSAALRLLEWEDFDQAVVASVQLAPSGPQGLDGARLLVARALAADCNANLLRTSGITVIGKARDQLIADLVSQFKGSQAQLLGLGEDILKLVKAPLKALLDEAVINPGLRMATWAGRTFRHSLSDLASPATGDILLYQARGKAIRDFILQTAESVGQPVILLAHSLGGVACVDLLISQPCPGVRALITAGSQAPFLYEIGALSTLESGQPLPEHFPPWLNFYDKNDLLSFLAEPQLKGKNKVNDIEAESALPFPASHSAYWSNPMVWQACAQFVSAL